MEKLSDLFFELSHEDRIGILYILMENPMKLTQIANRLDGSSQDAYRHLSRLLEAGLVAKNRDGDYEITSFGLQIIRLLPGYRFLSDHSEYFKTRNMSMIDERFMYRVGELSEARLVNDVMVALFDMDTMIREAEAYTYIAIDQMVMNQYEPLLHAAERGVEIRVIRPTGWRLPEEIANKIDRDILRSVLMQIKKGQIKQKELNNIPIFLALSEKTVSVLSFAKLDNEIDYLGFKADDEKAHNWCLEYYETMWEKAEKAEVRTRID
jgi:predicted transcriptional regulator